VLPTLTLLSTQIFPPFFSTNSLHSNKPNPVLNSPSVPLELTFSSTLKSLLTSSSGIPTPLSSTAISIVPFGLIYF
jgi:hypothetical protein